MFGTIDLLRIHVTSNAKPTSPWELYEIPTDSTEGIQNIARTLLISVTTGLLHPVGNVFSHGFWSDRVPWLVIDFYSSIELAKEEVSFVPKLFQVWIWRHWSLLVDIIIFLGSLISIKVFFVGLKLRLSMLDQDDDILLLNLSDLNLYLSDRILINWKSLQVLVLTLLLLVAILHAIISALFGLLFICALILL